MTRKASAETELRHEKRARKKAEALAAQWRLKWAEERAAHERTRSHLADLQRALTVLEKK